jgi:lactosylceramide 4-alpha-galactosyltransferase
MFEWQARELQRMNEGTYSIHLWNKRSNHLTVQKGSIVETLFKRSCMFCKQVAES